MKAIANFLISEALMPVGVGPVGRVPPLDDPVGFTVAMGLLLLLGAVVFVWILRSTPKE